MDVLIPNLGDIEEVEVIEITVSPGDQVQENDGLIVIESDKASMEVPCPSDLSLIHISEPTRQAARA